MRTWVIDTSVIVMWYRREKDEVDVGSARALLRDYVMGLVALVVPELTVYELGNVLAGLKNVGAAEKRRHLEHFFDLGLRIEPVERNLADHALRLADSDGITYCDACFIALAESLGCDMVTADERLARRTSSKSVRSLSSVGPIGPIEAASPTS